SLEALPERGRGRIKDGGNLLPLELTVDAQGQQLLLLVGELRPEQREALVPLARHRSLGSDGCGKDRCRGRGQLLLPAPVRLAKDASDRVVRETVRPRPQRALPAKPAEVVPDVLPELRERIVRVVSDQSAADVAADVGLEALDDLRRRLVPLTPLHLPPAPSLELAPVSGCGGPPRLHSVARQRGGELGRHAPWVQFGPDDGAGRADTPRRPAPAPMSPGQVPVATVTAPHPVQVYFAPAS